MKLIYSFVGTRSNKKNTACDIAGGIERSLRRLENNLACFLDMFKKTAAIICPV